jgi:hypothetical protein
MRNLYLIKNKAWSNNHTIISDDGDKVNEVWGKYRTVNNFRMHYLEYRIHCCDSIKEQELETYFFKNAKGYLHTATHQDSLLKLDIIPGLYHPRIYRPIHEQNRHSTDFLGMININGDYDYVPHNERSLIQSVQQLSTLINRLVSIFNNIYPTEANFKSYGHEIRNLLILACTEVEAQLKGILMANGYEFGTNGGSMKHYVKLFKVLRLDEYVLKLSHFPDINNVSPFKDWNQNRPTKSLTWYDNYNAVKHSREDEFYKADLISVINAVCAVAILLYAQYGDNIPKWKELIGNFFEKQMSLDWKITDHYFPPFDNDDWIEYKFKI